MTREKEFADLKRQIKIQKVDRKLRIYDTDKAEKYLAAKNYFNVINGFETLILDDSTATSTKKEYSKGKNIRDFYRLNKLDKNLSKELFTQISNVEIELKTRIAYHFCEKYCRNGVRDNLKYEDINYYTPPSISSGKPKYTKKFYTTRVNHRTGNSQVDPFNTHNLFKKHSVFVETNNLYFTGQVSTERNNQNVKYLKGDFTGTIKGLKSNTFKGTLKIDLTQKRNFTLSNGNISNVLLHGIHGMFDKSLSYSDYCKIKYPYISS